MYFYFVIYKLPLQDSLPKNCTVRLPDLSFSLSLQYDSLDIVVMN